MEAGGWDGFRAVAGTDNVHTEASRLFPVSAVRVPRAVLRSASALAE